MKTLIKPSIIASFVLMLAGLIPGTPVYMSVLGLISMAMWLAAGIGLLGGEDRDYLAQLELVRLEHKKAVELVDSTAYKFSLVELQAKEALTAVSRAISENREIVGRLR